MGDFLKIVVTPVVIRPFHAVVISALLDNGIDFVHLRYPDADINAMEQVIKEIPEKYHIQLRVHSHFELVDEYSLAGPHLNSRCPVYKGHGGTLSRSCHSIDELSESEKFEYSTLSPIFDSISKNGYHSQFSLDGISRNIAGKNVIALGGVTPEVFSRLAQSGFSGAAMLGYIWDGLDPNKDLLNQIKTLCYNL